MEVKKNITMEEITYFISRKSDDEVIIYIDEDIYIKKYYW
jgi:hypothetical protein